MKVAHRAVTTTLSAAVVGMLLVPAASGCAMGQQPAAPFAIGQVMQDSRNPLELVTSASLARDLSRAASGKSPSIVGMWSFQFISVGNTTRNPSIPDGTQINFGYTQFHSGETEILNAGARSPAQENFCLGVWQQTGNFTYQVNHFALNYDATPDVGFALTDKGIYYYSRGPHEVLQFFSFATGKSRALLTPDKPPNMGLSVSPDGYWLIYSQLDREAGSNLMLVDNFR